jgi:hypothetical protein
MVAWGELRVTRDALIACILIPAVTFVLGTLIARWLFDHWDESHNTKVQAKLERSLKNMVRKRQKFTKYTYEDSSDDYSSEDEDSPANLNLNAELPNVAEPKSYEDYTCRMCAMTLDGNRLIKVSSKRSFSMDCGHRYCYECWGDYLIQFDAMGKRGMVLCLQRGCNMSLDPSHVYAVLAKNEVETEVLCTPSPKSRPLSKRRRVVVADGKNG